MRYPKTTLVAAVSGLALLAGLALPASAMPSFASSRPAASGLTLVKNGGGGGGGGGGHGGNFAAIGGGHPGMGMHGAPHGNAFVHIDGGHNGRIARGGDFDGGRRGRMANNWNGNWNGDWHGDHHHHGHLNRFYAYPFFYGGYYAYNGYGGDCGWLYRRALATGSPYWWNRYYACIY
jgi:hypothetical protein